MATEFRPEVAKGTGFEESVTHEFIANNATVALWGPVVYVAGANSVTDMPKAGSTTTAGNKNVLGVCVALPSSGTITAGVSFVTVCIFGLCKIMVVSASVAVGDTLETSATAGKAQKQATLSVRSDTLVNLAADVVTGLNNIKASFAIALTSSSSASSIVLGFVGISAGSLAS